VDIQNGIKIELRHHSTVDIAVLIPRKLTSLIKQQCNNSQADRPFKMILMMMAI
jgi:hypothetical protein